MGDALLCSADAGLGGPKEGLNTQKMPYRKAGRRDQMEELGT